MAKIRKLIEYKISDPKICYPHMVKEHHLGRINKDKLPEILAEYEVPDGYAIKAILKK